MKSSAPQNIVLIGFMGSGKTTVGRALARRRGWRFVDTDERIRRAAGRDVPALFAEEGEAAFREREAEIVREVAAGQRQVIATGGGAVLRPENVSALRESGLVVWLTARPEVVVARTQHRAADRPLLAGGGGDLLAHVLRMLGERGPLYQAAAHVIVDTSDRVPSAIAAEIERRAERPTPPAPLPRKEGGEGSIPPDAVPDGPGAPAVPLAPPSFGGRGAGGVGS